jgi:hypothetical protein
MTAPKIPLTLYVLTVCTATGVAAAQKTVAEFQEINISRTGLTNTLQISFKKIEQFKL